MTKFTVVWHSGAQDELTRLWVESEDRSLLSNAANSVDSELAMNASQKGFPVTDKLRLLIMPPLRVLFAVSEPDRLVRVLHIVCK